MKNLLLIMVLLISSIVLSQEQRIYVLDKHGDVIREVEKNPEKVVTLTFMPDVPELTKKQVSELLKNGEVTLKKERVKGAYDNWFLFYTPYVKKTTYRLNDTIVSCKEGVVEPGERMFSWWFLFALLGIISMILFQAFHNPFFFVFAFFLAFFFVLSAFAFFFVFAFVFFFVSAFALAFFFALADGREDKKIC